MKKQAKSALSVDTDLGKVPEVSKSTTEVKPEVKGDQARPETKKAFYSPSAGLFYKQVKN